MMHIELTPGLNYVERMIQIIDYGVKELRRKTIPIVRVLWNHRPIRNITWENGGEHEADISGIIPKYNLNFEDEISFKEGRVVTPAF
jgi:hypothetical protein